MKKTSIVLAALSSLGSVLIQSEATLEEMPAFFAVIVAVTGLMALYAIRIAHQTQRRYGKAAFHLAVSYASLAWFVTALIIFCLRAIDALQRLGNFGFPMPH